MFLGVFLSSERFLNKKKKLVLYSACCITNDNYGVKRHQLYSIKLCILKTTFFSLCKYLDWILLFFCQELLPNLREC